MDSVKISFKKNLLEANLPSSSENFTNYTSLYYLWYIVYLSLIDCDDKFTIKADVLFHLLDHLQTQKPDQNAGCESYFINAIHWTAS